MNLGYDARYDNEITWIEIAETEKIRDVLFVYNSLLPINLTFALVGIRLVDLSSKTDVNIRQIAFQSSNISFQPLDIFLRVFYLPWHILLLISPDLAVVM